MNLPEFAVKKPVSILMIYAAGVVAGLFFFWRLPIELMPNASFGNITIFVNVRGGMPPNEVESLVTRPIEEAVYSVSHLRNILSTSKKERAIVTLQFESGTNMELAAVEVREKFTQIKNKLPQEAEKPVIARYEESDMPIIIFALSSTRHTPEFLRRLIEEKLKDKLARINGVANIEIGGGRERKILVEIDQGRLQALNLPIERITAALGLNNINLLAGDIERTRDKYIVRTIGHFQSIEEIKNIGLLYSPEGSLIRLKDVAEIKDSYLEPESYSRLNSKATVSLYIQKESTANTVKVCQAIIDELSDFKKILPQEAELVIISNQAVFIKEAIDAVKISLLYGAVLVVLILSIFLVKKELVSFLSLVTLGALILALIALFVLRMNQGLLQPYLYALLLFSIILSFFLADIRSTFIVTMAIPTSLIFTFIFMYPLELSLNIMTLSGLALASGMVVDDSIVVTENIFQNLERKKTKFFSAEKIGVIIGASKEMILAILASTLTTIIVFLPIVFFSPQIKILYKGLALTVTFSLFASFFISLTLIPFLVSRIKLKFENISESKQLVNISWPFKKNRNPGREKSSQLAFYRKLLFFTIRHRYLYISGVIILFVLSLVIYKFGLAKEFISGGEQNEFVVFVELPSGARLDISDKIVAKVEEKIRAIPELKGIIKNVSSRIEGWSSKIYVSLIPQGKRESSIQDVIDIIRPRISTIGREYDAFVYFSEQTSSREIVVDVYGYDYTVLVQLANTIGKEMGKIPGLSDIKLRYRPGRPELGVVVDREKAAYFGLNVKEVAETLHAALRGLRATLFHTESQEIETITRLDEKYRKSLDDLRQITFLTPDKKLIYLEQIAKLEYGLSPSEIWRKNKNRMIQVSANLGRVPLSQAVEKIKKNTDKIAFPKDYFYQFGDEYVQMKQNMQEFSFALIITVILIYAVLASLFESFYQPLIIMITVPLETIGVFLGLWLTRTTVSIGVLMGVIMLGGIVVKNAIILVDRTNFLRKSNSLLKSVVLAGKNRLRPILMTAATTVLGMLPMALDRSEGATMWSPLAITVIGGLFSSTFLTLLAVPAVYIITEDVKKRVSSRYARN